MKDTFEQTIKNLTSILTDATFNFLSNAMGDDAYVKDVIDIVLSSHMSSLFHSMKIAAKGNSDTEVLVENFLVGLEKAIKNLHPIDEMVKFEVIK